MILRAADRIAVAWKNGGGLTREVAVHPAGSDLGSFDWRVSLAEVRQGGPFSTFPGIDRHLAVIAGRLELSIPGRPALTLSAASAPCDFPGDVGAAAEPLHSPVSDLNVMTRRGRFEARLQRCRGRGSMALHLKAQTSLILALAPLSLRAPPTGASLGPLDAARLSGDIDAACSAPAESSAGLDFWLIEIRPSPISSP